MDIRSCENSQGEVNMEASVTVDEVVRAGGFGATDDLSSLCPVACDSTDFEVRLQNVPGYQDPVDNKAPGQPNDILKVGEADSENTYSVEENVYVDPDYVVRAGGFGATDNISSFLPVASDFTDFEAHLRDARDYEDLKEEITRPGLGWTNETK